ncbi:MAG: preprotein translocase subunit SecG [Candidatus Moranbacteria bacterium]|nr:preprotein translocase subunit SecG [Candidatus Moranbacteria bacterium]
MVLTIISLVNIISAVLIIASVLLQSRGSGLSGTFGGESESFYTRRGFDKILFTFTIIIMIVFVGSVLARLILS